MSKDFSIPPSNQAVKNVTTPEVVGAEPEDSRIKFKDENSLNEFWNCILKKVPFKKTFDIRGLHLVLRTKTAKEVENLMKYMDKNNTTLISTYDYLYSKALLATSLVQYGQDFLDSGSFEQKLDYVDTLPDVVLRILIKAAASFEKEIEQMEEEIYNPNF